MIIRHNFGAKRACAPPTSQTAPLGEQVASGKNIAVLMIGFGDIASIFGTVEDPVSVACLSSTSFLRLDLSGFRNLGVDLVISPLLCSACDAHECAQRLFNFGFAGQFRALVNCLPDTGMVVSEFRRDFPDLDFKITETNPLEMSRLKRRF